MNSEDRIYISMGFILLLSILLLGVSYYYDIQKNTPDSIISIESMSKLDLTQYEPLIPPLFYINIENIDRGTIGNIMARLAVKYKMRSHKPFFSKGLPLSTPKEINQIFMHPSWMKHMPYSFAQYIAWTYCIVPNHLMVGCIGNPWTKYKSNITLHNRFDELIFGSNTICREIGIQSLTGLRNFISEQKYLLFKWLELSSTIPSIRMTGLVIWINYDDLNRSLLIFKKWLGLSDIKDIYYNKHDVKTINVKMSDEWVKNNSLDIELYQWTKELLDTLVKSFYPMGIKQDLDEFEASLSENYNDPNGILNMRLNEYKNYILTI